MYMIEIESQIIVMHLSLAGLTSQFHKVFCGLPALYMTRFWGNDTSVTNTTVDNFTTILLVQTLIKHYVNYSRLVLTDIFLGGVESYVTKAPTLITKRLFFKFLLQA